MNRNPARKPTKPRYRSFDEFLKVHAEAESRRQKEQQIRTEAFKQAVLFKEGSKDA
jgi:hypothetical protein